MPKLVWTIAGFDPSSGAGITADLMTFAAHGLFGCSAITAYTVQSTLGVAAVEPLQPKLLRHTLQHLFADLPPAGLKIGMLGSPEIAEVLGAFLQTLRPVQQGAPKIPIVLDPVLRASSGRELYPVSMLETLHTELLPLVDWITPNWGELGSMTSSSVSTPEDAERAARDLLSRHPHLNVVVTAGDQAVPADLLVTTAGERVVLKGEHIATEATHGTGCAFSSALLSQLVKGEAPEQAVRAAKAYVSGALRHAPGLGHGKGPMALLWPRTSTADS